MGYASREECQRLLDIIDNQAINCCRCKFFDPIEPMTYQKSSTVILTTYDGFCRRYPPIRNNENTCFPIVNQFEWCGEFSEGVKLTVNDVCYYTSEEEE